MARWHWKRWLKWHGPVANPPGGGPVVVLFGRDGPDDDDQKYVVKVRPGESLPRQQGYHVDFVVSAECTVWKYWLGRVHSTMTWEEMRRRLGRTGQQWVAAIQEAFGREAPPPCGRRTAPGPPE